MCGLVGFIGESSNKELSQKLTTELFVKTECRGFDASGFYCVSTFDKKEIYHHKKPTKSSIFVNQEEYKSLLDYDCNLGLFHCRAASVGVGAPIHNENNHPFVSYDCKKAVMHNGLIEKLEYENLKNYYEVETLCDSEILLRILEQEDDIYKKLGFFFENTDESAYAAAYTENTDTDRNLYLFRNEQRPLYIIDLTQTLNQVYFFSTVEILMAALSNLGNPISNLRIHEVQPYHLFSLSCNNSNDINMEQFEVKINKESAKSILKKCNITKTKSDWVNKITSKNGAMNEVIHSMCQKLFDNINKMELISSNLDISEKTDQEKINLIYAYLKEANKRTDMLKKQL
jgi:glucosamine 6-phosphate synthetase-like amidotransferase/phosphosugar isomerase protein